MARLLFTTSAMPSHVRPAVPVVRRLVDDGHDVTWYTGAELAAVVGASGAAFVPSGVELDVDAALRAGDGRRGPARLDALVRATFLDPIPR